MATVQGVKTQQQVEQVDTFLLKHYGVHFQHAWRLGCNLGLRIGDLLSITMMKVDEALQTGYLTVREAKTAYRKCAKTGERKPTRKPARIIKLTKTATDILTQRRDEFSHFTYLFQSESKNLKGRIKPMTPQAIGAAFRAAGESIGVKMATHSSRKSRATIMYHDGVAIERICKMLNHSDPSVTLRYIGIEQSDIDELNEAYDI